jgi:Zn-finger nucleic acid-binding protein
MSWVAVGEADLLECGSCEGTWVEATAFERICADRESQAALLHPSRETPAAAGGRAAPMRYRPCPQCSTLMNRVNFGKTSGAVVDVCKGHGTFLDRGELHQIVRFIQGGGIDRARAAELERLADERRRLHDAERMHARMFPSSGSPRPSNNPVRDLLAALFGTW